LKKPLSEKDIKRRLLNAIVKNGKQIVEKKEAAEFRNLNSSSEARAEDAADEASTR